MQWLGVVMIVMMVATMGPESEGQELISSLPEAADRLRRVKEKMSQLLPEKRKPFTTHAWMHREAEDPAPRRESAGFAVDALGSIRDNLTQRLVDQARLLPSNNHSIISIAFLAFGVILFDVLGDALMPGAGEGGREAMLPGLGLLGDGLNNLTEVVLNTLTIYLYREESPDCGERLLCESSQQAGRRGLLDGLAAYLSGLLVSFFLPEAPLSRSLQAMRAGRQSHDCVQLYPVCSVTL